MSNSILESAFETLKNEGEALLNQIQILDASFEKAVQEMVNTKGKVVVTGMGKSGWIGHKISATLASTGTPSFFLHPGEAYHGDLGMVTPDDLILALSNSGETDEVLKILPFFKDNGNKIISITSKKGSTLMTNSDLPIFVEVKEEACPLNLAPTTSTTLMLAVGDAMAVAAMRLRGFKAENFARFHPGGSLGRKLLAKVEHFMHTDIPVIHPQSDLNEIISAISKGRLGLALVNTENTTLGVITDGDLRRLLESKQKEAWNYKAQDFMSKNPRTIYEDVSLHKAEEMLKEKKITSLIVTNRRGETTGVIQIYDLK